MAVALGDVGDAVAASVWQMADGVKDGHPLLDLLDAGGVGITIQKSILRSRDGPAGGVLDGWRKLQQLVGGDHGGVLVVAVGRRRRRSSCARSCPWSR